MLIDGLTTRQWFQILRAPEDEGAGGRSNDNAGGASDDAAGNEGANDDKGGTKTDDQAGSDAKKPTDEEARLLKEVMAKKKALTETQSQLSDLQKQLKAFEGLDVEAAKTALAKVKEAEMNEAEKRGEFERVKEQMRADHQKTVDTLNAQIEELKGALGTRDTTINELTVGSAFSQSAFIKENLVLTPTKARVIYGGHFEVQDGNVVAYDKPKGASDRAPLVDGDGSPLSFEAAIAKLVEIDPDKDNLIRSKIKPGSDSKPSAGKPENKSAELTGLEKIAAGLATKKAGK